MATDRPSDQFKNFFTTGLKVTTWLGSKLSSQSYRSTMYRLVLFTPNIYTTTYGKRAYSYAAPELWN